MSIYSFGHLQSSSTTRAGNYRTTTRQYSTQAFDFLQPEEGSVDVIVHCNTCNRDVKVTVCSSKVIWKKRLKHWWAIPACVLFWLMYALIPHASGFWNFLNEWSGIFGVITFFVCAWALGKLFKDREQLMFDLDTGGHAILWNKIK